MIKLSDFARTQGVTPRAVQRLFKKYKDEISGHFEEKGQNGTWLDETAQDFLRSKMKQNPVTIFDEKDLPFYDELKREQAENRELREKLSAVLEKLDAVREQQMQLQSELMEQKLLASKATDAEKRASEAEEAHRLADEAREQAEKQAVSLRQRNLEIEAALTSAEDEKKTLEDIAEINAQDAERAKLEADELRAEIEKLKKRNLWQRIFNK